MIWSDRRTAYGGARVQVFTPARPAVPFPAHVRNIATFENLTQFSTGIMQVIVKGAFVVRNEQLVAGVTVAAHGSVTIRQRRLPNV